MPLSDIVNKHLIVSGAFTAAMYKSTDMCLSKPIGSTLAGAHRCYSPSAYSYSWRAYEALLSYLLGLVITGQNRGNLSGKLQREHTTDKTLTFPVHGTVARFLGLRVSASSSPYE
ncbi:hypothetical protein C353_05711 [Cryptococcus neoformans AD1-83a]|nr:hypothetical protein C353_05711 [Cryptococcus neoformans var. grubii AD1-83a]